jgi:SAM-dependent MidA family methyltransferase
MMAALRRRALGREALSFEEFMDVALYEPGIGYYRKPGPRIGYGPGTDFLTASASAPLFGKLVVAACVQILGARDPGLHDFVELGAEGGKGILDGVAHPFRSVRLVGAGEPIEIKGACVVFSNELFDAQPFRRFRMGDSTWRELGVSVASDHLEEVILDSPVSAEIGLPEDAPVGYGIDAPLAAGTLAKAIAVQPWHGLFLTFDYGKMWEEIATATPQGTARAFRNHAQGNDLLAYPGDQDLTCHVCWDWIGGALASAGFSEWCVESQEAFFVRHAAAFMETVTASEAGRLSRDKLSLLQLLHPANMGQKFQALWALRGPS